jgi:hypothetical protein
VTRRHAWLLLIAAGACGGEPTAPAAGPAAPEPRLVRLDELKTALQEHRKRGALINVWATW